MSIRLRDSWTVHEDKKMQNLLEKGVSLVEIAKRMGRTYQSVTSRRKRLKKESSVTVNEIKNVVDEVTVTEVKTPRDSAKDLTRVARGIARENGKRITMAMFFVEDL
jgi:hypothetical protein